MDKILTITFKEMRGAFTDRSLLALMFAAPLVLATIIAVTFGAAFTSDAPIRDIPVAVVNLDAGTTTINNGAIVAGVFLPAQENAVNAEVSGNCATEATDGATDGATNVTMDELVNAVALEDAAAARTGVDDGTYAAAIIIPADFSAKLTYSATNTELQPTQVEVYGDPQSPIAAGIIRSIVESIITQLGTGNVAIAATLDTVTAEYGALRLITVTSSEAFQQKITCAFAAGVAPITLQRETIGDETVDINPLVVFGAAQAIFFALFAANGFASTIMEERRNGTLQRLLVSPTSRLQILLGKMNGTFSIIVVQLLFLFLAFTLVASLLAGELQFIWGANIIGIIVVLFSACLAVTGLGAIVAAASKTPEQASIIGSILSIVMAVLGGSFGFSVGPPLAYGSIIYWGTDGFIKLATGRGDFWLNAVVMLVFGMVSFIIALVIFNRRVSE